MVKKKTSLSKKVREDWRIEWDFHKATMDARIALGNFWLVHRAMERNGLLR